MRLRTCIIFLLLLANGFFAGMILAKRGNEVRTSALPKNVRHAVLTTVDNHPIFKLQSHTGQGAVLAVFNTICSSCPSGAALDSLRALAAVARAKVSVVLLGDYSPVDCSNIMKLWGIPFTIQSVTDRDLRTLARVGANHYFVARKAIQEDPTLILSVEALWEVIR